MNCDKTGCLNQAFWHPVFLISFKGIKLQPIRALVPLHICDDHRKEMKVEDILTDKGWNDICAELFKIVRKRPKRNLTELAFAPVGGQESREAMAKLRQAEQQADPSNILRSG
jgi:hypothetical protein